MSNRVIILGNSSAAPTKTRSQSGQYLQMAGHSVLIDCGEGTQNRMMDLRLSNQKLSHIFISHLHGDHFLGLFPLINTMNLQDRETLLTIIAPKGIKKAMDVLTEVSEAKFRYPVQYIELDTEPPAIELENITVQPFRVKHGIPCFGFRFEEKPHRRKLNPDQCRLYKVPVSDYNSITMGADWQQEDGTIIANHLLTGDPPKPASYVYITDTLYGREWLENARHADLLYHEATYLDNLVDKAHERYHTTAKEAAIFAREAGVRQLIIGHFSGKYKDLEEHLDEARNIFPNSELAEQGQAFEIR